MCKSICDLDKLKWQIRKAIGSQQSLGDKILLQGYLTVDWLSAIQENHPDKPKILLTHLYIGLWKTLFASIWGQQNSIAHSNESIVIKIKRGKIIDELKEWKKLSGTRPGSNQQLQEVYYWTLPILTETVNLLVAVALNFRNLKLDKMQTLITGYFTPRLYDTNESD